MNEPLIFIFGFATGMAFAIIGLTFESKLIDWLASKGVNI